MFVHWRNLSFSPIALIRRQTSAPIPVDTHTMKVGKNLYKTVYNDPHFPIRGDVNSLNCDYPFPNAERLEKEERLNLLGYYYTKWTINVMLGLAIGFIMLLFTFVIEELTILKVNLFMKTVFPMGEVAGICIYLAFTICCSVISSLPVIFWQPTAQGVGVPETVSYLNGVDVPALEHWSYIVARSISTIFMVLAGLPGGQTEALLPIGLFLAANICRTKIKNYRLFPDHRYDSDRRDFGAVGLGAAASANFGTPVGGVFFVLQQLSTWHAGMTFVIIVASLMASYLFITVYNVTRDVQYQYNNANAFFSPFEDERKPFLSLNEFPTFILMGVIGGGIGALWVGICGQISRFRVRYVKKKYSALIEIVVVAVINAMPYLLLFFHYDQCSEKKYISSFGKRILDGLEKDTCTGETFDTNALLLLGNPESVVRTILILPDDQLQLGYAFWAAIIVFVVSALHLGTATANGIVVPHLLLGALWGRLFKQGVADHLFAKRNLKSMKYSFFGAVAQVSGVTQYSVAFGVMMAESVGVVNFSLPVFLIIFVSRYVSQLFTSGIYDVISCVKGYAILVDNPPPLCVDVVARDIMSKRLVCLPKTLSAGAIKDVLSKYPHLEFPILDINGVLDTVSGEPVGIPRGVILRKQLLPLLRQKRRESVALILHTSRQDVVDVSPDVQIDIGKYMNHQPFYVIQDMPLTRVHALFEDLNLHTLLVVNESLQLIGVITRRDLAVFKIETGMFQTKITLRPVSDSSKGN